MYTEGKSNELNKGELFMSIPRTEHPNPQLERKNWINLNGKWQFEIDQAESGRQRGLIEADLLNSAILVPFCPESALSGIGNTDFLRCVWYKRSVTLSAEQVQANHRLFLHIGASDYFTEIWVNGKPAGTHKGGYASFAMDITSAVVAGENFITICVSDDTRNPLQPRGKQSESYASAGCDYTRTTGIWQTVWLEIVPSHYIRSIKLYPDSQNNTLTVMASLCGSGDFSAEAFYGGKPVGKAEKSSCLNAAALCISLSESHLWELGKGRLYDLTLRFGEDEVHSYFGLRNVGMEGMRFKLNGKSVFQRLVLDQGFYRDGIYTAPSEEDLIQDIRISMAAGFNGARLHQKVFEPRFLYHCDRLGYMVWGEYGSWGLNHSDANALSAVLPEWMEVLERDFNHPALIGWCPFNETWDWGEQCARQNNNLLRIVYQVTKSFDSTRPCIDTSGNFHVVTDIFDVHDYDHDGSALRSRYQKLQNGELEDRFSQRQHYNGEPVFISEYGGIGLNNGKNSWSYGNAEKSEEEFLERYRSLTESLLENPCLFGFCYTQLYDIEQEQNGLYTYDRVPKVNMDSIRSINSQKAAIEDEQ